jgi:CRISPR system Cascade subunit CasA
MQTPGGQASIDLLAAPILTIDDGRVVRQSLTQVLALLLAGAPIGGFPNLAAEQQGYWHRFLVRCAAKVLRTRGWSVTAVAARSDLATSIAETLEQFAPGAWFLYQPDLSQPGFLQPPLPGGGSVPELYSENSVRLLTGALGIKDHERKYDQDRELTPERSVYALVEYQGGVIFGGRGNYASAIMGSAVGAGSGTPFMGVEIHGSLGETFRHDVSVMLARWDEVRRTNGLEGDVWALWAQPWDGRSSLPARRLDPAFIPTARLVRLGAPEGGVFHTVWFRPTEKARVEDHTGGGNLGDPFTPMVPDPKDPSRKKVRGTLAKGYDYREVVRLLCPGEDGEPSPTVLALLSEGSASDDGLRVVFQGTAYEQGKTLGFHQRTVLLPPGASKTFRQPKTVRAVHATMLQTVKDAKAALSGASRIYMTGDVRGRDGDEGRVSRAADALEGRIDTLYVDRLLSHAPRHAEGDEGWRRDWGAELRDLALKTFDETMPGLPTSLARRFERESAATGWLRWKLSALVPEQEGKS